MTVYQVGSAKTYTTIAAAFTAIQTDLGGTDLSGGGGGERRIELDAETFNEQLIISTNFTNPSVSNYLSIVAAPGAEAKGQFGVGPKITQAAQSIITAIIDYTRIEDIELEKTSSGSALFTTGNNVTLKNLSVGATGSSSTGLNLDDGSATVINCVVKNFTNNFYGFEGAHNLYGCVSDNAGTNGFFADNTSTLNTYNCISVNSGTTEFNNVAAGSNNISEDGTAVGANSITNVTVADIKFENIGTDYNIQEGSIAQYAGVDQSSIHTTDAKGRRLDPYYYPIGLSAPTTVYSVGSTKTHADPSAAMSQILTDTGSDLSQDTAGIREIILDAETFVDNVAITGFSNATSSDFVRMKAAPGAEHGGVFGAGVLIDGQSAATTVINISRSYTEIIDIEVVGTSAHGIYHHGTGTVGVKIIRCLADAGAFAFTGYAGTRIFINCWARNSSYGFEADLNGTSTFYGCGVYNSTLSGFHRATGTANCYNCIAFNSTNSDFLGTIGGSNNASGDGTAKGSNPLINLTATDIDFVNAAGGDFHVGNDSVLNGAGTDQSGVYTTDVDGEELNGRYPIGYDLNALVFFVDLDDAAASAGAGSQEDPLNKARFEERIVSQIGTPTPTSNDIYNCKGRALASGNYTYAAKIQSWDLATNGYWRLSWGSGNKTMNIPYMADGYIGIGNQHTVSTDVTYRNMFVRGSSAQILFNGSSKTFNFEGCTFFTRLIFSSATSGTINFKDTLYLHTTVTAAPGSTTVNFDNVASRLSAASFGSNIGINTGSEFDITGIFKEPPANGDPESYHERAYTDSHSVSGSGNYTNIPYDFFGATRSGIGAQTFGAPPDYYVDLEAVGPGDGSSGSPFDSSQFLDRIENNSGTPQPGPADLYKVRGSLSGLSGNHTYFYGYKIESWDLVQYGPWKISSGVVTINFNLPFTQGRWSSSGSFVFGGYTYSNLSFFCSQVFNAGSSIFKGCSLSSNGGYSGGGEFENSILKGSVVSGDYSLTHCVLDEDLATFDGSPSLSVNVNNQFSVGTINHNTGDVYSDYAIETVVPAISINGSGTYTGYETGFWGNPRPADNEFSIGAGIGASFFPAQYLVDAAGSKDYTLIGAALDDIPDDLSEITGFADVIVKAGTYSEGFLQITGFSNASSSNYIRIRPFTGEEHKGLWSGGVFLNLGGQRLSITTNFCIIENIRLETSYLQNTEITASSCVFRNVFLRNDGTSMRRGFYEISGGNNTYINCIVDSMGTHMTGAATTSYLYDLSSSSKAYGCVGIGTTSNTPFYGFFDGQAINCVMVDSQDGDFLSTEAGSEYNASSDGTAPGTGSLINLSDSDIDFIDKSGGDFHLGENSALIHAGSDQSGVYTEDIDGDTIEGGYPIGYDHNFVWYVNLGSNTDAQAGSASGSGSISSPLNARAWHDRINTAAGSGVIEDIYKLQGSCYNVKAMFRYIKCYAWDLVQFGPWRLKFTSADGEFETGRGSAITREAITTLEDAIIDRDGTSVIRNANHMNNCLVRDWNPAGHIMRQTVGFTWLGCTVAGTVSFDYSGPLRNTILENTILIKDSTGSVNSYTINLTNCVVSEPDDNPTNWPFGTVVATGCQFGFIPSSSIPGFLEADKSKFYPDSAVTILSSGNFTGYETGLFGESRTDLESEKSIGAIGAHYFDFYPFFEAGTPNLSTYTATGADVNIQIDESGIGYVVVVPDGSTAPSSAQVKAGTDFNNDPALFSDSVALTGTILNSITISGLAINSEYDVYVVAEDSVGNIQPDPTKLDLDIKTPVFEAGTPVLANLAAGQADVNIQIDENGAGYVVVVNDGDAAPTSTEVKNGQSSGGGSPVFSGSVALTGSVLDSVTATGLGAQHYDVYVVAEDSVSNLQASPTKLDLDLEPPFYLDGTPLISVVNLDGGDVDIKINENGAGYLVVVAGGDSVPTPAQVKAGQNAASSPAIFSDSVSLTGGVLDTITVSGLTPTTYDIYVTAEDTLNNLKTTVFYLQLVLDADPPVYAEGYPKLSNDTGFAVDTLTEINEDGTVYVVAVQDNSLPPSSSQVKNGLDGSGNPAISSNSSAILADTETSVSLSGLDPDPNYDIYVMAEDLAENVEDPIKLNLNRSRIVVNQTPVEVITNLAAQSRSNRQTKVGGIAVKAGEWIELVGDRVQNVTTGSPGRVHLFPLLDTGNIYEKQTVVGRVTCLENATLTVAVNIQGYVPGMIAGDDLVVSVEPGEEGRLKSVRNAAPGTYEVVARCEAIDNDQQRMRWKISSPKFVTIT